MLLKTSFVIAVRWLAVLSPAVSTAATPPKACAYPQHGAETARFLEIVDRVYDRHRSAVVRAHSNRAADYATACFAVEDSPGDFVGLIERQRQVQLAPSITAGYSKRVGELGIVRVVRFRSAADAQRCMDAIEEARRWARTQPYNPEFIEPLRTESPVLLCGPFLVQMSDAARGYPDLRTEYGEFRARFYEALRRAKP